MSNNLTDLKYLNRAIQIADNGRFTVNKNPRVGAVIVYDDNIIAEAFHIRSGESHAEVLAINKVTDITILSKSTIYVSLEPCSHFGKTPPCANLLVRYNFKRVVIAYIDENPIVKNNGLNILNEGNIKVTVLNELKVKSMQLNKRFFNLHTSKRPYITLKWAESSDGFIAPEPNINNFDKLKRLSNYKTDIFIHNIRKTESAILVGANTIKIDNPQLNTRILYGKSPVIVVVDASENAELYLHKEKYNIFINDSDLLYFNSKYNKTIKNKRIIQLDFEELNYRNILYYLYSYNINSILIEGGKRTLEYFINNDLWDKIIKIKTDKVLISGIKCPVFDDIDKQKDEFCFDKDTFSIYKKSH